MKHFTTCLFFCLFTLSLFGQISIEPDVIEFEGVDDTLYTDILVTNHSNNPIDIFWTFDLGDNFPPEWGVTICDSEACYLENILKCSTLGPNVMEPGGSFTFKFMIKTNGVGGKSYGILHLFDDTKFENEVATSNSPTTSVQSEDISSITIYPNPTRDLISITDDIYVGALEVRSILGQMLYYQKHTAGKVHTLSHLPNGVFFARLYDNNEKILKTMRLVKN